MTQSLINNGIEGNTNKDKFKAVPKWICAEEFKPRPENVSGANRVELARTKCDGTHLTVIYNKETGMFIDSNTLESYTPGALEIRITEIQ